MIGKAPFDFLADFPAVHVDCEVAILPNSRRGQRILVREPTQAPRRADALFGDATSMS